MKRIIWSTVGLVFGLLMIFGAVMGMTSSRVECGGSTMQEGDICQETARKSGRVTESTYEEQKAETKIGAGVGIVFGLLITAIAAQNLRIGIRNRKRGDVPAGRPGHGGPGYPPQQQWNHQPMPPQQWNQQPQQWNQQQWNQAPPQPMPQPMPQQQPQPQQWNRQPPPPPGWGG